MKLYSLVFINVLLFVLTHQVVAHDTDSLNVLRYHVQLEPDIHRQSVKGNVTVDFLASSNTLNLNCGQLVIDSIKGKAIGDYEQHQNTLTIHLDETKNCYQVQIFYHGKPKKGLVFNTEQQQAYTIFFTEEWMVCNNQLTDKANITLDLIIPEKLNCIADGELRDKWGFGDHKTMYTWYLEAAVPAYTYGFVIGDFNKLTITYGDVELNYYAAQYKASELKKIFDTTAEMLSFFETRSGIPYFQTSYSQVLIGDHYQEMAGLAVLKSSYGQLVLKDSTETNLIAHELAHQWWGNMITCQSWNHFWLNEGMATYMSAAFNECRFGNAKYQRNIQSYYEVYKSIKNRGNDKSLVFEDWSNPTNDDRNLVYFKGAYVLHLLRKEMGSELFWAGIKRYSQAYYGKSASTQDFQQIMEQTADRSLQQFFNQWIYN